MGRIGFGIMELQPEDVRVPSEESSPTHVPPDDLLPYQEQIGASLAPRISATRTSPTTLVRSPIQLTVIGPWLNHARNVDDPTLVPSRLVPSQNISKKPRVKDHVRP